MDGAQNIVLIGGPSKGKTHVATAFRVQAIEHHRRKVRFFSTTELVNALEQEKARGKAGQIAESLTKLDFVIHNELGYLPFSASVGALTFHRFRRQCCADQWRTNRNALVHIAARFKPRHAGKGRLPGITRARDMPCLPQRSAQFAPASCSCRTPMIRAPVRIVRLILCSLDRPDLGCRKKITSHVGGTTARTKFAPLGSLLRTVSADNELLFCNSRSAAIRWHRCNRVSSPRLANGSHRQPARSSFQSLTLQCRFADGQSWQSDHQAAHLRQGIHPIPAKA